MLCHSHSLLILSWRKKVSCVSGKHYIHLYFFLYSDSVTILSFAFVLQGKKVITVIKQSEDQEVYDLSMLRVV